VNLTVAWPTVEQRLADVARDPEKARLVDRADLQLRAFGFLGDDDLTEAGHAYFLARFVTEDDGRTSETLAEQLKQQPTVTAFCGALWPTGDVSTSGAVNMLKRVNRSPDEHSAKRWLELMNKAKLITYNRANPRVRILYNANELMPPEESALREQGKGHLIDPDTPFSNVVALRDLLRAARGSIRWYEQHMPPKVLEVLIRDIASGQVREIRLLSGPANIDGDAKADFKRFKSEMASKRKIVVEWRVTTKKEAADRHGRFFITDDFSRNIPPLNSILKGSTDEILPSEIDAKAFDEWWTLGTPIETYTPPA